MIPIKRALLSCWDKTGLAELALRLQEYDVEIISSGGTAAYLAERGVPVIRVEDLTGYPSILGGRVKTLHPLIHAAILAKSTPEHQRELEKMGVQPIQLVVVNLYPFVSEALQKKLPPEEAVEFIDVGGPAMLRAAAKNYHHAAALYDPRQYEDFLRELAANGGVSEAFRRRRAREAFFYTAWYDGQVESYFAQIEEPDTRLPQRKAYFLEKIQELRYGENPHQPAAVYRPYGEAPGGLAALEILWGKSLSFNNYVDVHAAYALATEFAEPAAAIIKHTNPCGAAISAAGIAEAFEKALRGDPLSAFGGIVACNRAVDAESARRMAKIFFECIIAPEFEPEALEILRQKKNLRLLKMDPAKFAGEALEAKSLNGAFLLQQSDRIAEERRNWQVASEKSPGEEQWAELAFAWKVAKHVKSNAIVLAKDREIYGTGAGQMSRVDSVKIAVMKAAQAGRDLKGSVLASDAFFPFRDGIDEAAKAGVSAIIQPGGSLRDEEVIKAADEHGISMVFTGVRHFKH
ncbi:MAG: bifunctional phosphoribosylaminoimidazolecarboxamide formyltransferase/IMP cyclohydrolase [Calditrichaceae bacterium]|nr:bifunctional phosphoribosylaminoimidazolecarboxamide formyltransferase/IMP cyclohydrolase [Calditrichia bacterium]NUQ40375.1 bifunctional phosphoribosylaminoimidazolecarboxamide formyltransferase/IMP cyclohydrolase [Calditrichaceae bacterium]